MVGGSATERPGRTGRAGRTARRRVYAAALLAAGAVGAALFVFWPAGSGRAPDRDEPGAARPGQDDEDELPAKPSRQEVGDLLREIAPAVALCGRDGIVRVHLEISGKTGQVRHATVAKQYEGTEVAGCATRIVLGAQFPRFGDEKLTVVFPFFLADTPRGDAGAEPEDSAAPTAP